MDSRLGSESLNYFSIISTKLYALGTQKNHHIEMLILFTHIIPTERQENFILALRIPVSGLSFMPIKICSVLYLSFFTKPEL